MNPQSQPSGREFGELVGEVRAISGQITEMQARNTREISSVLAAIGEVRHEMTEKAPDSWVKDIDIRTDRLEAIVDKGSGAAILVRIARSGFVALVAVLGILVGKGGL